ncbi:Cyclin-dependent kinases regulatory subunit [Diplonema papillatum]|nr:Cyclin-dependent kinases regulatory subunit [Diplonema papillatum]
MVTAVAAHNDLADKSRRVIVPPSAQSLVQAYKDRIRYSDKYNDDVYEYRHVILPKELKKLVPDFLMTETQWRSLGVQQSLGWEHYMIHAPERYVLCFRRSRA